MCAIAGITNDKDAVAKTYLMLYALQHRGQESAGIAAAEGKRISLVKKMGLVRSIFKEKDFKKLSGDFSIGHIRYSTAGSSMIKNAQPFVMKIGKETVAICHNGNLVNATELKKGLRKQGVKFESNSDTEVVLHLMKFSKKKKIEDKLIDALSQVKGAYSLLILAKNKLIAARDPFGFRPLSLGKMKGSYVLASENCAFRLVEAKFVRDINPGEVLVISKNEVKSLYPFPKPKNFGQCFFELVYFSRPDSFVFGHEIANFRKLLGKELAKEDNISADLVTPVPDSSNFIALGYGQAKGVTYEMGILRSHYIGRTFIEPDQEIRNLSTKLKLFPMRGILKGKKAVIIDDSIVRGTTSQKIISLIKSAGKTKKIHFRVGCPRIISPCYFGIDTPTKEELIASSNTDSQICKKIGADTLHYQTIEGLKKCLGKNSKNFCYGCLTGKYPIEVTEGMKSCSC